MYIVESQLQGVHTVYSGILSKYNRYTYKRTTRCCALCKDFYSMVFRVLSLSLSLSLFLSLSLYVYLLVDRLRTL